YRHAVGVRIDGRAAADSGAPSAAVGLPPVAVAPRASCPSGDPGGASPRTSVSHPPTRLGGVKGAQPWGFAPDPRGGLPPPLPPWRGFASCTPGGALLPAPLAGLRPLQLLRSVSSAPSAGLRLRSCGASRLHPRRGFAACAPGNGAWGGGPCFRWGGRLGNV